MNGGSSQQDYEFSELENRTVGKAGTWATALGVVLFIQAGLALINLNIINAVVQLVIGLMLFQAGRAFKRVVVTEGNDLIHLMEALGKLSSAFTIRIVVVLVGVVFAVIALLIMLAMH